MSSYFGVSISIEYVIVLHRESKGIIFIKSTPGINFDADLIETFRRAINFEEIKLPNTDSEITQTNLNGKNIVIRAGKLIYTAVIINQEPNRFTRETLHSFGIRFESRWGKEIRQLYGELGGNVSIFHETSDTREAADDLVEEVFHLSLSLPHKLGIPTKKLKGLAKDIWNIAENLARGKDFIFLSDLIEAAKNNLRKDIVYINDSIFEIISLGLLVPVSMDEFREKNILH